jgi:hypothetical protein
MSVYVCVGGHVCVVCVCVCVRERERERVSALGPLPSVVYFS